MSVSEKNRFIRTGGIVVEDCPSQIALMEEDKVWTGACNQHVYAHIKLLSVDEQRMLHILLDNNFVCIRGILF